jgi:hypothetical protein
MRVLCTSLYDKKTEHVGDANDGAYAPDKGHDASVSVQALDQIM